MSLSTTYHDGGGYRRILFKLNGKRENPPGQNVAAVSGDNQGACCNDNRRLPAYAAALKKRAVFNNSSYFAHAF
jgi:hypothetical protein